MKSLFLIAASFCLLQSFSIWKTITGNGIAKTDKRTVTAFTELSSGGPVAVNIAYGQSNSITIEGDENILPYIETSVKDEKLVIKVKEGVTIKPRTAVKVQVMMTVVKGLSLSGSGSINGDGDFLNDDETVIRTSGSGKIQLAFKQFGQTSISMSGSGSVELKGTIENSLNVSQSGSGHIDCLNVPCKQVDAHISGSGSMKVNAQESIAAHISGSGHIYYTGNPSQIDQKVSGSGGISKL